MGTGGQEIWAPIVGVLPSPAPATAGEPVDPGERAARRGDRLALLAVGAIAAAELALLLACRVIL